MDDSLLLVVVGVGHNRNICRIFFQNSLLCSTYSDACFLRDYAFDYIPHFIVFNALITTIFFYSLHFYQMIICIIEVGRLSHYFITIPMSFRHKVVMVIILIIYSSLIFVIVSIIVSFVMYDREQQTSVIVGSNTFLKKIVSGMAEFFCI